MKQRYVPTPGMYLFAFLFTTGFSMVAMVSGFSKFGTPANWSVMDCLNFVVEQPAKFVLIFVPLSYLVAIGFHRANGE